MALIFLLYVKCISLYLEKKKKEKEKEREKKKERKKEDCWEWLSIPLISLCKSAAILYLFSPQVNANVECVYM